MHFYYIILNVLLFHIYTTEVQGGCVIYRAGLSHSQPVPHSRSPRDSSVFTLESLGKKYP